jgi:hypothetical protein
MELQRFMVLNNSYLLSGGDLNEDFKLKLEYMSMEKEKTKELRDYRERKLELLERIAGQQGEMLQLQRRTTTALEMIAARQQPGELLSPFSVSPVIRFDSPR